MSSSAILLTSILVLQAAAVAGQQPCSQSATGAIHPAPFDLLAAQCDANGFELNPLWRWQATPGNAGKIPDTSILCPGGLPDIPECTSQFTFENLAAFPKVIVCWFDWKAPLLGHINWRPATFLGQLEWHERSTDWDTNWRTLPLANGGLTQGNVDFEDGFLGLECDHRETLSGMQTKPWAEIAREADGNSSSQDINRLLGTHVASITGLFGVDCEHSCHSELHPVYSMAVQLKAEPTDNVWGIFARNWGNEGFCAHGEMNIQLTTLKVVLPHPGSAAAPTVMQQATKFQANDSAIPFPTIDFAPGPPAAVVVTFTLSQPEKRGLAELELHLQWPDGTMGPRVDGLTSHPDMGTSASNSSEGLRRARWMQEPKAPSRRREIRTTESVLSALLPKPGARLEDRVGPAYSARTVRPTEGRPLPETVKVGRIDKAFWQSDSPLRTTLVTTAFDAAERRQTDTLFDSICGNLSTNSRPKELPPLLKPYCEARYPVKQ